MAVTALTLGACDGGAAAMPPGTCERARDHALANWQQYVDEVVTASPSDQRARLRSQGAREIGLVAERFVAACRASSKAFRPSCFESPAREQSDECRAYVDAFYRRTIR